MTELVDVRNANDTDLQAVINMKLRSPHPQGAASVAQQHQQALQEQDDIVVETAADRDAMRR